LRTWRHSTLAITAGLTSIRRASLRHAVPRQQPVWHAIGLQNADDLLTLDAGAITPVGDLAVG
jgi:hypothetical protein